MNSFKILVLFSAFLVGGILFYQPQCARIPRIQTPINTPISREYTFEDAQASIKAENLKSHVYYLASNELEGRMSGERGNNLAATYIKSFYEKNNLPVRIQSFENTQNVITWVAGSQLKDEIVVIGAHYDHIGTSGRYSKDGVRGIHPGADDNASGSSAVLEMARASSKLKPRRTILFISFSGEEEGLRGSSYYVKHPVFPIQNHVFMINLDMIGYYKNQSMDQIANSGRGGGDSDHLSFYNAGIPVVFFFTGLHPYYHTIQDTPDKLNYMGMEKIVKFALLTAWNKANSTAQWKSTPRETYSYRHLKYPQNTDPVNVPPFIGQPNSGMLHVDGIPDMPPPIKTF